MLGDALFVLGAFVASFVSGLAAFVLGARWGVRHFLWMMASADPEGTCNALARVIEKFRG